MAIISLQDDDDNVDDLSIMKSTWRRLKMTKDRVRLSFKKSMSRSSQMEKRKRGKLKIMFFTKRADLNG